MSRFDWKTVGHVLIIAVVLVLVSVIGYYLYVGKELRDKGTDFCPMENPTQLSYDIKRGDISIVLVDTSNYISADDGEAASYFISKWIRDLPPFHQLFIVGLPQSPNAEYEFSSGPWCVAWDRASAPKWLTGGLVAERNFKEFLSLVNDEFVSALDLPEADQSPIIETLAKMKESGVRSVFIISDMMQYTEDENHYRQNLCLNCYDIEDMEIHSYYIYRDGFTPPGNHREIWNEHVGRQIIWYDMIEYIGATS